MQASLQSTGYCIGDTIFVVASDSLSKIQWLRNDTIVETADVVDTGLTITVAAGGNGRGDAANQLAQPECVFVDDTGNVYVSDYLNGRIQKWAPGSTTGITAVAGNKGIALPDQISAPSGLFVDAKGNIYVSPGDDEGITGILKFSPGATSGVTVAGGNGYGIDGNQLTYPWGIAFDKTGHLYVSETYRARVQKFPPNSNQTSNAITVAGYSGIPGSSSTFLNTPMGIYLDNNDNLYIADEINYRIQKYAPGAASGITVAGGNGSGNALNQLKCPVDVKVDGNGNMYISDQCNNRVVKWLSGADSGTVVAGGSDIGDGINQLDYPFGIFLDKEGNLYICDANNDRVLKYQYHNVINKTYVPAIAGNYKAIVKSFNGCVDTIGNVIITPNIIDSIYISQINDKTCEGYPIQFKAITFNAGSETAFKWQVNGKSINNNDSIFTSRSLSSGDSINCILINNDACSIPALSNTVIANVLDTPKVYAGADTVILPGSSIQLNPTIEGNIYSYAWSPSTGLNSATIATPLVTATQTQTYRLRVTDINSCSASSQIKIIVYRELLMPTAFTPNGDGRNDIFRIPADEYQQIKHFIIYNRWGKAIFETADGGKSWDGTVNGIKQPTGTYVWQVDYFDFIINKMIKASGTVVLLR